MSKTPSKSSEASVKRLKLISSSLTNHFDQPVHLQVNPFINYLRSIKKDYQSFRYNAAKIATLGAVRWRQLPKKERMKYEEQAKQARQIAQSFLRRPTVKKKRRTPRMRQQIKRVKRHSIPILKMQKCPGCGYALKNKRRTYYKSKSRRSSVSSFASQRSRCSTDSSVKTGSTTSVSYHSDSSNSM